MCLNLFTHLSHACHGCFRLVQETFLLWFILLVSDTILSHDGITFCHGVPVGSVVTLPDMISKGTADIQILKTQIV